MFSTRGVVALQQFDLVMATRFIKTVRKATGKVFLIETTFIFITSALLGHFAKFFFQIFKRFLFFFPLLRNRCGDITESPPAPPHPRLTPRHVGSERRDFFKLGWGGPTFHRLPSLIKKLQRAQERERKGGRGGSCVSGALASILARKSMRWANLAARFAISRQAGSND